MKKNYISPDIEIIELEFETVLLDGTNPGENEHSIFGDENDESHTAGSDESL